MVLRHQLEAAELTAKEQVRVIDDLHVDNVAAVRGNSDLRSMLRTQNAEVTRRTRYMDAYEGNTRRLEVYLQDLKTTLKGVLDATTKVLNDCKVVNEFGSDPVAVLEDSS